MKALEIRARPAQGIRRAGRHFGVEPVTILLGDLDEDELDAIRGEPDLVVVETDVPLPDEDLDGVIRAMMTMDPRREREGWWTKDGLAATAELERRTGEARITAEQRDAAHARIDAQG